MTNDEINKYIHTEIMGKCWHDEIEDDGYSVICNGCKVEHPSPKGNNYFLFDRGSYCSSLDVVRPVELKVIEKVGHVQYATALSEIVKTTEDKAVTQLQCVTAAAEQRARACVAAHKEGE